MRPCVAPQAAHLPAQSNHLPPVLNGRIEGQGQLVAATDVQAYRRSAPYSSRISPSEGRAASLCVHRGTKEARCLQHKARKHAATKDPHAYWPLRNRWKNRITVTDGARTTRPSGAVLWNSKAPPPTKNERPSRGSMKPVFERARMNSAAALVGCSGGLRAPVVTEAVTHRPVRRKNDPKTIRSDDHMSPNRASRADMIKDRARADRRRQRRTDFADAPTKLPLEVPALHQPAIVDLRLRPTGNFDMCLDVLLNHV